MSQMPLAFRLLQTGLTGSLTVNVHGDGSVRLEKIKTYYRITPRNNMQQDVTGRKSRGGQNRRAREHCSQEMLNSCRKFV
jgi:hypothetical protein